MSAQRDKKMINICKIEKITGSIFMFRVKIYKKNLNTVCIKPEDLTFIIIKIFI